MRKRFNRNAISSENYEASMKAHIQMLNENHRAFCNMIISGEISFDIPMVKDGKLQPKFKTIKVFGKDMTISIEEYNIHCAHLHI